MTWVLYATDDGRILQVISDYDPAIGAWWAQRLEPGQGMMLAPDGVDAMTIAMRGRVVLVEGTPPTLTYGPAVPLMFPRPPG